MLADKPQAEACSADATDSDSVERCLIAAHEKHGRLEGIVNCVRSLSLKPAHATRDEDWENMLATVH